MSISHFNVHKRPTLKISGGFAKQNCNLFASSDKNNF